MTGTCVGCGATVDDAVVTEHGARCPVALPRVDKLDELCALLRAAKDWQESKYRTTWYPSTPEKRLIAACDAFFGEVPR